MYAGTIGYVSGAEVVLETAARLAGNRDVKFVFVGDGPLVENLKREARERCPGNAIFVPFQDRSLLSEVQAAADVSLVTMNKGKGHFSVPSKVLAYMAAGRPIVASVDDNTETAEQIRRANCGMVVPAGDAQALSEAITRLHDSPELCAELGVNGRSYLEQNLNRKTGLEKYLRVFEELVQE